MTMGSIKTWLRVNATSYTRALAVVLALVAFPAAGLVWLRHRLETTPPVVPPPDLMGIFFDTTPVTVVFTFEGQQVLRRTTADDIRSNPTLWRHMHLAEWNTVPEPPRREALDKMLARYRSLLMNPRVGGRYGCRGLGSRAAADAHSCVPADSGVLGWVLRCGRAVRTASRRGGRHAGGHRHVRVVVRSPGSTREP